MDLVYSVRAGRPRVLLYVLAEHHSRVGPWMELAIPQGTVATRLRLAWQLFARALPCG